MTTKKDESMDERHFEGFLILDYRSVQPVKVREMMLESI